MIVAHSRQVGVNGEWASYHNIKLATQKMSKSSLAGTGEAPKEEPKARKSDYTLQCVFHVESAKLCVNIPSTTGSSVMMTSLDEQLLASARVKEVLR